jgi:uncharacterized protein
MNLAWFRFYEELNEFLPSEKRKRSFSYSFNGNPSVKDSIEALGVPHTEVDLILVNNHSVKFSYHLRDRDFISVYPVFESLDISPVTHLRAKPLRNTRFILDVHLGKLAKYLRLCGFDTHYSKNFIDSEIIRLSITDKRIILTRDVGLLKNKLVTHGYWIRSQYPKEQLKEVLLKFDLASQLLPFTRCMECNCSLTHVSKEDILHLLMPKTAALFTDFRKCPCCNRIYWEGSHYQRMKIYVDKLIKTSGSD